MIKSRMVSILEAEEIESGRGKLYSEKFSLCMDLRAWSMDRNAFPSRF